MCASVCVYVCVCVCVCKCVCVVGVGEGGCGGVCGVWGVGVGVFVGLRVWGGVRVAASGTALVVLSSSC